jgi:hypothetical protein
MYVTWRLEKRVKREKVLHEKVNRNRRLRKSEMASVGNMMRKIFNKLHARKPAKKSQQHALITFTISML